MIDHGEFRRNAGRPVRRPDCTLATVDHNVPYVSNSSDTLSSMMNGIFQHELQEELCVGSIVYQRARLS